MEEQQCNICLETFEAETEADLKKKLRAHYIGKSDHEYDSEEFEQQYFSDNEVNDEEAEIEEDGSGDAMKEALLDKATSDSEEEEHSETEESDLMEVEDGMNTQSLDDLVQEADEETQDEGDSDSSSSRKGLDTAINKGWGRILTADLDPEDEETSNIRKNLQGLAEDVGLGENAKHYYEEEIKGGETDPKSELMGSLVLALALSLSMRPDLPQKLKKKADEQTGDS
jgi:hypothetical protein